MAIEGGLQVGGPTPPNSDDSANICIIQVLCNTKYYIFLKNYRKPEFSRACFHVKKWMLF
jgi:hypothetical protein